MVDFNPRQNRVAQVDRLAQLNDPSESFKNPSQLAFMRTLVDIIRRVTNEMVSRETASPFVMLLSPNGTTYRVTVDDTGVLETEIVTRG